MNITAIPLPYIPAYDSTIILTVFSCFIMSCILVAKSKKLLLELGLNFKNNKIHVSALSTKTNSEISSLILLIIQSCVMVGIITFIFLLSTHATIIEHYKSAEIIGVTTTVSIAYLLLKWIIYSYVGWLFERKRLTSIWLESYVTIIYYSGLILYPVVLYVIFSTTPIYIIVYIAFSFIIIVKMLMLYKWLKLFPNNIRGHLLLILYFCALEIIPYILIYKGIMNNINVLTINI